MESNKDSLSSLKSNSSPPILMGHDSPVEATSQGRVIIEYRSFKNVLHILKIYI